MTTKILSAEQNKYSQSTLRAIRKYGESVCREAYFLHAKLGYGASGIAAGTSVGAVCKTTSAADAAIRAGRELAA